MIKNTFLLLLLLLPISGYSDSTDIGFWRKPKFFLQLDKYNSIVGRQGADVSGIKAGLEFGKKYRFGLGYYNLKSDIIEIKHLTPAQAAEAPADTVKARLRMSYIPLCFEYIFYDKGKWQFGIPIHLGFGATQNEQALGRIIQELLATPEPTQVAVTPPSVTTPMLPALVK